MRCQNEGTARGKLRENESAMQAVTCRSTSSNYPWIWRRKCRKRWRKRFCSLSFQHGAREEGEECGAHSRDKGGGKKRSLRRSSRSSRSNFPIYNGMSKKPPSSRNTRVERSLPNTLKVFLLRSNGCKDMMARLHSE